MNTRNEKICVLYSRGPHLIRLLLFLRKEYPGADVTLLVPENYPTQNVGPFVGHILFTPDKKTFSNYFSTFALARKCVPDVFVLMFPSLKLRLFSKLLNAKESYCFTVSGEFTPVTVNLFKEMCSAIASRILGRCTYYKIKSHILRHKIGK